MKKKELKLVKIASVKEHMDAHYRGEISYSKAVDLINSDANKNLKLKLKQLLSTENNELIVMAL